MSSKCCCITSLWFFISHRAKAYNLLALQMIFFREWKEVKPFFSQLEIWIASCTSIISNKENIGIECSSRTIRGHILFDRRSRQNVLHMIGHLLQCANMTSKRYIHPTMEYVCICNAIAEPSPPFHKDMSHDDVTDYENKSRLTRSSTYRLYVHTRMLFWKPSAGIFIMVIDSTR